MLLVDEFTGTVIAASENTERFLGVPLTLVLGSLVDALLEREVLASVHALALSDQPFVGTVVYLGAFPLRGLLYTVAAHRIGLRLALEFEREDRLVSPELMNAVITNFVGKLSKIDDQLELCRAITRQVHDLTTFDRVLLYSFDEAGHGNIIAEENNGALPSYLGLRFPGTDIPRQARELYILNTVRIIPDADYAPSPLRGIPGMPIASLDLSLSLLRSVSPIHLEYMKNMGTQASMSISIVCEGKLWGLISCHHSRPRTVAYLVRSACDLLTKLVGTQLTGLRNTARLAKRLEFHAVQRSILTRMAAETDSVGALASQMESLTQVTGAAGTALVLEGNCRLTGVTPSQHDVMRLVAWIDEQAELELFSTCQLSHDLPWADHMTATASGVLAMRISAHRHKYLLWFRPEVVQTIHWAGKPSRFEQSATLNPRQSFEAWKELLHGQAEPWSEAALESARDFRTALLAINLKRAEVAADLSEARFDQLTHALPNLVWAADDRGLLTYVNQNWRDQGLNIEGLWFDQPRIDPVERRTCADAWLEAVENGTPFDLELNLTSRAAGSQRSFILRATPYLTASGTRAGWVGTGTDLTDSRERERVLRVNEKLALTGRMTSVIAHEINNPLESITNLLYLLRTEVSEGETARGYIALAESELQRIAGITRQTLRWSRESVGVPEFGLVRDLFADSRQLFTAQLRNRSVTLQNLDGEDLPLYGILGQLKQVMANLFSNAIAAVPVGGKIRLSAHRNETMLEIVVEDNGRGMTEETLQRLFEPFYSTKGDLGNGLGLYICREIMEKHHGQLVITSQPGRGTQARILLPIHAL